VPTTLVNFVDNEYLTEGFRAGMVGLTLLFMMFATIAVAGWRSRASPDPMQRSLGALALALVVFFALNGLTSEYMFFGGVSQEFAMLMGLLSAKCALRVYATRVEVPSIEVGNRAAHSFIADLNTVQ
jgi:O-antigen ligase